MKDCTVQLLHLHMVVILKKVVVKLDVIPMLLQELDESAVIDGAGYLVVYFRIILPLIRPALVVVLLFTFVGVWNDFLGQLVYLGEEKLYTVSLGLSQFRGNFQTPWNELMAASAVLIAPAVLVFLIGQRYFIEGLTMTGIKG